MYLHQALQRNNNNLDLFRLLAACIVIYGHSNAMVPDALKGGDFVAKWLVFDYSGSLAVKIFFFLSGLVVTNSLLEKQCLVQFTLARVFRIWPALLTVLFLMACIAGPLLTQLPVLEYLKNPATAGYVIDSAQMRIRFELPGVFADHKTSTVNGSLWSIPYEVQMYCLLAALFALGVHKLRWLVLLGFVWVCVDPLLSTRTLFSWRAPNADIDALLPCFLAGTLMVIFKKNIQISLRPVIGFFIFYVIFKKSPFAHYFFYGFVFFAILYLSTRPWMLALRLPADISYGVYLWGWPVQQLLAHGWPELGAQPHRALAMAGACVCGTLSWYGVEKPAMAAGRRCYAWWEARFSATRRAAMRQEVLAQAGGTAASSDATAQRLPR